MQNENTCKKIIQDFEKSFSIFLRTVFSFYIPFFKYHAHHIIKAMFVCARLLCAETQCVDESDYDQMCPDSAQ